MNLPSQLVSVVAVVHLCSYGDRHGPGKEVKHANNRTPTSIEIILHLCAVILAVRTCFDFAGYVVSMFCCTLGISF